MVLGVVDVFVSGYREDILVKIASVREVVLGAPLRLVLKHLATRTIARDIGRLVAIVHRPKESFFIIPQVKFFFLYILFQSNDKA